MNSINLISLKEIYELSNYELLEKYLISHNTDNIKEIDDYIIFIDELYKSSKHNAVFEYIYNHFFIGFKIPQIGKEFDLLNIGEKVINIEIKKFASEDKIKAQLLRNKYYLDFLEKEISLFTFISGSKELFMLDDIDNIVKVDFKVLLNILLNQKNNIIQGLDKLFKPTNYLVSPFNSTNKFINGEYFLTHHQEEIRKEVIKLSNNSNNIFCIKGKPGTGKTLLVYDLAKYYIEDKKDVCIIHCGNLNGGHLELKDKYKWNIIPVKDVPKTTNKTNDIIEKSSIIFIDECQRIYKKQLEYLLNNITKNNKIGIFSYDPMQILRDKEGSNNISETVEKQSLAKVYKLSDKIRTNREIADFIRVLFNRNKIISAQKIANVSMSYFKTLPLAKSCIESLVKEGWKYINYTESKYKKYIYDDYLLPAMDNSHSVIGQEFDNVVVVIDKSFYYNENGELSIGYSPYYNTVKMLYQNITRVREKLHVIIIDNNDILNRCLEIINKN